MSLQRCVNRIDYVSDDHHRLVLIAVFTLGGWNLEADSLFILHVIVGLLLHLDSDN